MSSPGSQPTIAVRAVILTGAGERAFCAGADIKYMSEVDAAVGEAWGRLGHEVGRLLETMPKVTIAAIPGLALGGGCEIALACDLRYASSTARLGQPEVGLGIIPGLGRRRSGSRGSPASASPRSSSSPDGSSTRARRSSAGSSTACTTRCSTARTRLR